MASSCWRATTFCWRVRIIPSPVRSPTCASRGYSCPPKFRWLILPSLVRSNTAPQASSSHTRSGASLACSSALRQLFRNLPPRMVSRKCTIQLSLGLALPMAAAQPPSAMTVCALPNSDLEMIAVFLPASRASMAARSPEPPAPMTTTSYECRSIAAASVSVISASVNESQVTDRAAGDEHDVQVGQHQRAQGDPGELHVPGVQPGDPGRELVAQRVPGEVLQPSAGDVPARVAGQRVAPQQDHIGQHDQGAEAEAEAPVRAAEGLDH